jgi:hypothetical protein
MIFFVSVESKTRPSGAVGVGAAFSGKAPFPRQDKTSLLMIMFVS